MLKALLSLLTVSIILVTVSFAGLAYTGMSSMDSMDHGSNTTDADCLNHCLSVATSQTNAVTPLLPSLITLVVFVLLLTIFSKLPTVPYIHSPFGQLLHQLKLATIVIRD
jgi:hypothetical protein